MSAPWERPELTDDEKRAQRDLRDRLVRTAAFAVDTFVIDHRDDLNLRMTPASSTRLISEAVVGALLDSGVITEVERDEAYSRPTLPEHLQPDVAAEVERYRRMRAHLPATHGEQP